MSQTIVSGREPPSYWCTLTLITMPVHLSPKPEPAINIIQALIELSSIDLYVRGFRVMSSGVALDGC